MMSLKIIAKFASIFLDLFKAIDFPQQTDDFRTISMKK